MSETYTTHCVPTKDNDGHARCFPVVDSGSQITYCTAGTQYNSIPFVDAVGGGGRCFSLPG